MGQFNLKLATTYQFNNLNKYGIQCTCHPPHFYGQINKKRSLTYAKQRSLRQRNAAMVLKKMKKKIKSNKNTDTH